MRISERARRIEEEPFFIALNLPQGVLRLTAGEPDFPSAPFVIEAASRASAKGETHYTAPAGILPLREGISRKLKDENNLSYDTNEIVVTPGSSAAVLLSIMATIDPGDEVLLPDPAWFHYATLVELAGGVPRRVRLDPAQGFRLRTSEIEKVASKKTRLMILNTPSNPSGRVLSIEELNDVASEAERVDFNVLSDEIYEKIVYSPFVHRSIAALPGMRDRAVVTNGFSKGYALMGWRVGFAAAPRDLIRKLDPLLGYTLVCASSVSQYAALEAITNPGSKEYTRMMVNTWKKRRGIVMRYVEENESVISMRPVEGTFYAWIDVSRSGIDGKEAAQRILQEAKVGVMPGYLFGEGGKNHLRISFATSDNIVEEGMNRICKVLRRVAGKAEQKVVQ